MTTICCETIEPWLELLWQHGGSDLLLAGGSPPRIRVDGCLQRVDGVPMLSSDQIAVLVGQLLSPSLATVFEVQQDVDFAFSWRDHARLRGSAFTQRGETALALRMIPARIPTFDELGLPPVAEWLAGLPRGLALVTGPTGSGKSTTMASIIDRINDTRQVHVLTIEDPIEYLHHHKQALVSQREIGLDSPSFERALRSSLREDPDVLLIGEMRDVESTQIALTLAETGHLVFASLHTNDAAQAVDRILDVFPAGRQDQIRAQLSASLAAIIAQRRVARTGGGMVAAFEVLIANGAARNLIREGRSNQLLNLMTMSQQEGMRTLETSLAELCQAGTIDYADALAASTHPKELVRSMGQRSVVAAAG